MNQKHPIIDQYDKMNSVEISSDWNDQLYQRIKMKEDSLQKSNGPTYAVVGVLILFLVNTFIVYNNLNESKSSSLKSKYKVVASSFFIQTNSSKF